MSGFWIFLGVCVVTAAVVACLGVIAWVLICIQETLSDIYKECWVSRFDYREFWEKKLSGPSHACDSERMWIRRSLERECYLVWDVRSGNASSEITDLGGSLPQRDGAYVDAKEA